MKPDFSLTKKRLNTNFAPLCVLGQAFWERKTLDSLREFDLISIKTHEHTPGEKLMDAFLLILAGYPSLYLLNSTVRPDPMVSQSWRREKGLAEQSNISRTLDASDAKALKGLRKVSQKFWSQHSQLPSHDWRKRLTIDLDLSSLVASANAEDSTRGYVGKKMKLVAN